MPQVTFKSQDNGKPCHKYFVGEQEVPSVSFVIKPCVNYNGIKQEVMENARDFGNRVDLACQYLDEDTLDPDSLDPQVEKRLAGWIKFKKDFGFRPMIVAQPIAHQMNGMLYAGTPDRYGVTSLGNTVIDIKNTQEIEHHHQLQLSGYEDFFSEGGKYEVHRLIVQLLDGDYKPEECKDRMDRRIFGNLLAVAWWKWNRGIRA